jgi:hypothetical protein
MNNHRVGLALGIMAMLVALGTGVPRAASDPGFELARMIANENGFGNTIVLLGKLPKGAGGVPTPADGVLVGSVSDDAAPAAVRQFIGSRFTIFYKTSGRDAFAAYAKVLAKSGWTTAKASPDSLKTGGFVDSSTSGGNDATYCDARARTLTLRVPPDMPDELAVTVAQAPPDATLSLCSASGGIQNLLGLAGQLRAPLPELRAPAGAHMDTASPFTGPFQSATAYLKTNLGAAALLTSFESQFTAQGWTAEGKEAGTGLASQSFAHSKGGKVDWRAVLTVERVGNVDYAYMTAAREFSE